MTHSFNCNRDKDILDFLGIPAKKNTIKLRQTAGWL